MDGEGKLERVGRRCIERSLKAAVEKPGSEAGSISLREWLDTPRRSADLFECLHVFRQVAKAVADAHERGAAPGDARPSCFVLSALGRVSLVTEPPSCSSSDHATPLSRLEDAQEKNEDVKDRRKEWMESSWYSSPEEAEGGSRTFASDVYQLGILLFELFCRFDSLEEKLKMMADLRHRVFPPQMLLKWPKVASFCLWLLHPLPDDRPKMSEVLQSDFLNETRDNLEEHEASIRLKEEIEDQELLLEFLLKLQQRKQETANKLHDIMCLLSSDIEEVVNQQSALKKKGSSYSESEKEDKSALDKVDQSLLYSAVIDESSCLGSRKRFRPGVRNYNEEKFDGTLAEGPISERVPENEEHFLSKSSRLMRNFKRLEAAYLSTRCRMVKPVDEIIDGKIPVTSTGRGSTVRTEGSTVDNLTSKECRMSGRRNEWINPFIDGLCKYLSFSKLKVRADLKQGDLLNSSSLVCSLGFDRDKEFFATAGVNRKIKVFECDMILKEDHDIHYPVVEMASGSKLSSICWNNYIKSQIASSDFEGVVQVWDVTRSKVVMEMREHDRRVWSVDFSQADPTKLASGSDDGAVKLWNINQGGSIGTIRTKANVCSVQFPPNSAYSLAIGSADHKIHCYDLRNLRTPWCTLIGHARTVSYVKYLDSSTLVSSSTDNSLKLWDLSMSSLSVDNSVQTFMGHTNVKNFVGLSYSDGYIATGSETNEVFIYHRAFPMPVLSYKFCSMDPVSGREVDDATQFISSVCWRGQSSTLVAASSSGNIKILEMI